MPLMQDFHLGRHNVDEGSDFFYGLNGRVQILTRADQVCCRHCGCSSDPCATVNINLLPRSNRIADELNTLLKVLERWRLIVYGGQMTIKIWSKVMFAIVMFNAHVNHGMDAMFLQVF